MTPLNSRTVLTLIAVCSLLPLVASAQDAVTVGSATTNATSVDIPVYIRDMSGTALGIDQPTGSRIQSFSIEVDYSPAAAVSSVTFSRAGITAGLTPTFEASPSSTGSVSLLDNFQESTNLIPFTLNAAAPGDKVAHLVFNLSPSATPGSTITLTLNTSNTQLTNSGGTTKEFPNGAGGNFLTLVNGAITVPPLTVALSPNPQTAGLHSGTATMTATISAAVGSSISVALSSSSPAIATVPASVTIPAGLVSASFSINPMAIGQTTITATLPPVNGGATTQDTLSVVGPSINLAPFFSTAPVGGSSPLTLTITTPQPSDTVLTLVSSDTTVATVAPTVTLPAGQSGTTFQVNGVKVGGATIQATLPQSLGGATASSNVDVSTVCLTPAAPVGSAPSQAASGAAYDVTWPAVSGATEYLVDESTNAGFANPSTTTVTATKATFTHIVTVDTRYYYRIRAHNRSDLCDNTSPTSSAVSVVVKPFVAPPMRVLAVVGSLQGAFGSFFKTSVQLYNPKSVSITGKIVYHPAGTSGSAGDPSLTYALGPGKTITYDDLLPAMSKSGIGSADIVADLNSDLPVSSVRVFNDAGAKGTSGLSEEAIRPEDALVAGDSGVLIAPADFKNFRLNIGLRTLDQGATLTITVRDKDGIVLKSVDKPHYDPTFFTQPSSTDLLDGLALAGGETLTFTITSGSILIYASTTDNTTQDPTLQMARKI